MEILDLLRSATDMSRAELLASGGALLGFLGGTILAFAAADELRAHRLAIAALQLQVTALTEAFRDPVSPVYLIEGTEKHLEAGVTNNSNRTLVGIVCLVLTLVLTVVAFFVKDPPP